MIGEIIREGAGRMSATAQAEVITVIAAHIDHLDAHGQRLVTRTSPYTADADLGNGGGGGATPPAPRGVHVQHRLADTAQTVGVRSHERGPDLTRPDKT
jgi:hypothetical protein